MKKALIVIGIIAGLASGVTMAQDINVSGVAIANYYTCQDTYPTIKYSDDGNDLDTCNTKPSSTDSSCPVSDSSKDGCYYISGASQYTVPHNNYITLEICQPSDHDGKVNLSFTYTDSGSTAPTDMGKMSCQHTSNNNLKCSFTHDANSFFSYQETDKTETNNNYVAWDVYTPGQVCGDGALLK